MVYAGVGGSVALQNQQDQRGRHLCWHLATELLPASDCHQRPGLLCATDLTRRTSLLSLQKAAPLQYDGI